MTRLLLDENFPRRAADSQTQARHDVQSVAALAPGLAPGLADRAVLAPAREQQRCGVTFDSDFGDLVFHRGAEPPPCIVYLRLHPIETEEVLALTLQALQGPLEGLFIGATPQALRRRPFAASAGDGST